jgi:16S rRNA (uracil1498-N3)-methyltransferase
MSFEGKANAAGWFKGEGGRFEFVSKIPGFPTPPAGSSDGFQVKFITGDRMNHFFVPPEWIKEETIQFDGDTAHQIQRVLRLKTGEQIIALDNQGFAYEVVLDRISSEGVSGKVVAKKVASGEPGIRLHLYLCLTQRDKFEWMLQKCTEIGAASFTPLISERSLEQNPQNAAKKMERWQKIIQEAAEQCQRGRIPVMHPVVSYQDGLQNAFQTSQCAILAWEGEHSRSLQDVLAHNRAVKDIALIIGPEGGLSDIEARQAQAAGVNLISLGARILRMETAAIVTTALVLNQLGELEPNLSGAAADS